jgi:hypothetical protein
MLLPAMMMSSRMRSCAHTRRPGRATLRKSIADFCSSHSVTTTALRSGLILTVSERRSSSASLPSSTVLPETPPPSARAVAKLMRSPGLRVRSSLVWMTLSGETPM